MKIADYISKCIQEYPSLYKDVDYEKSKLKVLCQIFFTVGNGLEMADTENPKEGGYVVKPKYKKDKKQMIGLGLKTNHTVKKNTNQYLTDILKALFIMFMRLITQ